MTEPIKLPPLPAQRVLRRVMPDDYRYGDVCGYTEGQLEAYATAAIEADRQSRNCGQCVPLSTDGTAVFIDGVGEVPLDFSGQARGDLTSKYQEKIRALEAENYALISESGDRQTRGEPVAYRVLRKNFDGQWVSDDRYWRDGQPNKDLIEDIQTRSDGWKIEIACSAPQPPQIPEGYKPTKLNIGVSATAEGSAICIMKPNADGTVTVIYSGTHPLGDSLGCAMLEATPQPTTEKL